MSDYFSVHCPECGKIFSADEVNYSLADVVISIVGENPTETSVREFVNAGNIIDYENIKELVIDNPWLWDMRRSYLSKFAGPIELSGQEIIDFLIENNCVEDEPMPSLSIDDETDDIVEGIHALISQEKTIRATKKNPELNVIDEIKSVVEYAKTNKILFRAEFRYGEDRDENGKMISRNLICSNREAWSIDKKKCPNCGHKFSKWAGQYEEKVISVIGTPYVGKTAYFTSVLNELFEKGFNYNISVVHDQSTDDYQDFKKNMNSYQNGFAIAKTQTAETPQITVLIKNTVTNKQYLYTFVDIPGELFLDSNASARDINDNRAIIKYSDVIWMCISADQAFNPATINELDKDRNKITELNIENQTDRDLNNIAMNVQTFVNGLFTNDEEKPAIALIITKCDQIAKTVFEKYGSDKARYDELTKIICGPMKFNDDTNEPEPVLVANAGEPINNYTYEKATIIVGNKEKECGCYALSRFKQNNQSKIKKFFNELGDTINSLNMVKFNLCNAFSYNERKIEEVPVFFVASYGRKASAYNPANVLYSLLENSPSFKTKLVSMRNVNEHFNEDFTIDDLCENIYKYSTEDSSLAPTTKNKIINFIDMCEKNSNVRSMIIEEYKKYNPLFKFGLFNPAFWALAYTGLIDCVVAEGENWVVSTDDVENRNKLMLYEEEKKKNKDIEEEHTGFFGAVFKLFGNK